ncbi:TetR/AcrR family transcriptional regulator [Pseudonocardia sp. H11422]|uniref:TetR/AcrR family transcriptional regulator n=1 Tax=Pseudonocardia sp. H11422 TaxID=2835866 RepID=UPI001BDD15D6|nr:TetR/AcrR family transcriptional regulator [Pseudonocardia sp. H11422]
MDAEATAGDDRQESVRRFKRDLIRDAAKRVFSEKGIAGASVREIAKAAGYTTGAIYTYFATKEELYAAVLRDSLAALHAEVTTASPDGAVPGGRAEAALRALWTFYDTRRSDFELGFYLYGGARPVGLTRDLDRELNAALDAVMDHIGAGLVADGLASPEEAHHLAVTSATWVFGLLLMTKTGRLRSLHEDAEALLTTYLATLNPTMTRKDRP